MTGPSCRFLVRCLLALAFTVFPIAAAAQDFSKFKHDNPNVDIDHVRTLIEKSRQAE